MTKNFTLVCLFFHCPSNSVHEFYCNLDICCAFMLVVTSVYQMLPKCLDFVLVLVLTKAKKPLQDREFEPTV